MPYLGNVPSSFNVGTNNIDNDAVTTEKIANGAIVNADVNAAAAIAGTKISPDFGSQNIATTGLFSHALGSAAAPTLTFTGDTNTGIYSPGADQVAISTGGSGRLFVGADGKVAVGNSAITVADGAMIGAASSTGARLKLCDSDLGVTATDGFEIFAADGGDAYIWQRENNPLLIGTNGTERLRITSAGLVGVGTSSPGYPFHLVGTGNYQARIEASTGTSAATLNFGNASGEFYFGIDSSTGSAIGTGTAYARTLWAQGAYPLVFGTNNTRAVTIDSSQRVGIGTSTVDELLHLKGASAASTTLKVESTATASERSSIHFFNGSVSRGRVGGSNDFDGLTLDSSTTESAAAIRFRTGGTSLTTKMTLTSGGSLGIGTTSPTATLEVKGGQIVLNTTTANSSALIYRINDVTKGYIGPAGILGGSDNDMGYRVESGNNQVFYIGASEKARLDSSGRLLVGTSSNRGNWFNNSSWGGPLIQLESTSSTESAYSITNSANNANAPLLLLGKNRSGTIGGNTVVQSGDSCGQISFFGNDGTQMVESARIDVAVDSTPGADDMPGRLVFSTTADGQSSPTERAKITNAGYFKATADGTYHASTSLFHEFTAATSSTHTLLLRQSDTNFSETGGGVFPIGCVRSATSAYTFAGWYSGNGTAHFVDREFHFVGNGNGLCDGSWTGGGADYAEYFEWSDSNPGDEDRRGISVVLDGDKIRKAVAGEDPIGVISGNPSVVGDAAWNKWSGKYLRDEFGSYLLDAEGYRQLNPDFDPDVEYIPREQRPEWDCVGLMGKLRIRKGQVTGSRWIKMRDISETVEEWLVR